MPTRKRMFAFPIAYPDPTPGWDMDLAVGALGANLVEKTISEDRTTRSVEHVMSIEPAEMARFIAVIRDLETALGSPRRMMTPAEVERRNRSEEHTSELQSLMRISYAVFCLKKKKTHN